MLSREDDNDDSEEERVNFTVSAPSVDTGLRDMHRAIMEAHDGITYTYWQSFANLL
jgi:hypothetical protein